MSDRVDWEIARGFEDEGAVVQYLNCYFCVDNLQPETYYGERIGREVIWRTWKQLVRAHKPAHDLLQSWVKHPARAENEIRVCR